MNIYILLIQNFTRRLEPICYEATVTAFSRMGDQALAVEQLLRFETEKKVPMGRGAYTSAIASCRPAKDAVTALSLYERMKHRSAEKPSTVTRAALLDVLVAAGAAKNATAIALEQERSEEAVPPHMMANMALAFSAGQDFARVLHYIRPMWATRPDPALPLPWALCNTALKACARTGDHSLAFDILNTMRCAGVAVDVVMYGCVLNACSTAGEWKKAFLLLKEMESSAAAGLEGSIKPNIVCYTSVITALQQNQEWRKSLNLLVKMLNTGLAPDVQTYNAVLSACASAGETHMALKIFQAMKVQGLAPDEVTYATTIVACWRGNEWRQAIEMLSAMKAAGFSPNMITVTLVIDTLDKAKKFDLAVILISLVSLD